MTRVDQVLLALREAADNPDEDARWLSGLELLQAGGGMRYSARIYELRQEGWRIRERRFPDGIHRYRLVMPDPEQLAWTA